MDISDWPSSLLTELSVPSPTTRLIQREDDHGDVHTFALVRFATHDVLLGTSSRRELNARGDRSENLATNLILDVLGGSEGTEPAYRRALAYRHDRLWRNKVGAAHIQDLCEGLGILLTCSDLSFDPSQPGSSLIAGVSAHQAEESGRSFIATANAHRQAAHRAGQNKYAASRTHPAVRTDLRTRMMTYDPVVVDAIRRGVGLLIDGMTLAEVLPVVGGDIPAVQLRAEPDYSPSDTMDAPRSRDTRNQIRARRNQPTVALQQQEDGTPNPDYRPESLLDALDPTGNLRSILYGRKGLPKRDRKVLLASIATDLEGIDPRWVHLEFYATGIYRRLVKDQTTSTRRRPRYRWESFAMGPVDERGTILTPAEVQSVRDLRTTRRRARPSAPLPLSGLVAVANTDLYSRKGRLQTDDGRFVFRNGGSAVRGYRIYFEPVGVLPRSRGTQIVAFIHAAGLHEALADSIIESIDNRVEEIRLVKGFAAQGSVDRLRLQAAADAAHTTWRASVRSLADPDLREEARAELKTLEAERHQTWRAAVRTLEGAQQTQARRDSASVQVGAAARILARLKRGEVEDPAMARYLQARLRQVGATIDVAARSVRIVGVFNLPAAGGVVVRIPFGFVVQNVASDPWIAGAAGLWWETRKPFQEVWEDLAMDTPVGMATRWRQAMVDRLVTESHHARIRGPVAASLLVRCPHPLVVSTALELLQDGKSSASTQVTHLVEEFFFGDQPDLAARRYLLWTGGDAAELLHNVERAAAGSHTSTATDTAL